MGSISTTHFIIPPVSRLHRCPFSRWLMKKGVAPVFHIVDLSGLTSHEKPLKIFMLRVFSYSLQAKLDTLVLPESAWAWTVSWLNKLQVALQVLGWTTRFFWGEKNPHQYLGRRTLLKLDKKLTIEAWGGQQKIRAHDDLKFEMPLVCLRRRPWKWGLPARSRHDRPRWTNLSSLEVAEIAMEMNTWLIGCLNMLNRMFRLRGNTNTCCFL